MGGFAGIERLSLGPWQALERCVERLLVHQGFDDVRLVGGAGDYGADVVGEHKGRTWVAQAKFRSAGQLIQQDPVDEVTTALGRYGGEVGLIVTNSGYSPKAVEYALKRRSDIGIPIFMWNRDEILHRFEVLPLYPEHRLEPRDYQAEAIASINGRIMQGDRRGLVLMATGLGKSRVAAGVIEQWLADRPRNEVLVLVPSLELVSQIERSLWPYLPKDVSTHQLTGVEKPAYEGGVTVATEQSAIRYEGVMPGRYGLVIVDEAHHAPANGYRQLLSILDPLFLMGMTATPWRGDQRSLGDLFGEPTYTLGIVEGMQRGYLAEVDYRMLVDDIDWGWVQDQVGEAVSIRELNRKLFVPERDEAVIGKIREHLEDLPNPRCIVFCRSIAHAEAVGGRMKAEGIRARVMHSRLDRIEATNALRDFRRGTVPVIITIDMLNEGIDIPDVNLVVFLRVTHSRRIFVQQLGRGLRLAPGKSQVRVLDFVSDVRRLAAAIELNREAGEMATSDADVLYRTGTIVKFEGDERANLFAEYLGDVAELQDSSEDAKLRFPAP